MSRLRSSIRNNHMPSQLEGRSSHLAVLVSVLVVFLTTALPSSAEPIVPAKKTSPVENRVEAYQATAFGFELREGLTASMAIWFEGFSSLWRSGTGDTGGTMDPNGTPAGGTSPSSSSISVVPASSSTSPQ